MPLSMPCHFHAAFIISAADTLHFHFRHFSPFRITATPPPLLMLLSPMLLIHADTPCHFAIAASFIIAIRHYFRPDADISTLIIRHFD
jgi:hypothetical protein